MTEVLDRLAGAIIARTFDATHLNTIANHPQVRPMLGGEGPLDLSGLVRDPANLAIQAHGGGWVLAKHEAGTYELHTLFLPDARGRGCAAAAREMFRYVFTATDAREIVTRVPQPNAGAAFAARRFHFSERFSREEAWRDADGRLWPISYQGLSIDRWAATSADVVSEGEWFHGQIEAAKAAHLSGLGGHPKDAAHDRAAGAACLMIRAGNVRKGVWFYNRWARLAGYPPIALVSEVPAVIDIGEGVIVEAREGKMEVLQCP